MICAASIMLLDSWDLLDNDSVLPVAHRGRGSAYDHINESRLRSTVNCMVHCSHVLLESDWPMPACSESLGLFFGSPKTEPLHSLFAAAWQSQLNLPIVRPLLHNHSELWI